MTIRPRAARTVRELRSRLRDIAAASHANRVAARDRQEAELADREARLLDHFEDAEDTLSEATSIYHIELVHEDTGVHRLHVEDAKARLAEATRETRVSEAALRERARQLRSAERVVEKLEDAITRRESAAEQRANDDISSRRR